MKKLIQIQNELKVPKGNYNSFGRYKYRSAEDILESVKPILKKYECLLTLTDEVTEIANKIYLKATAIIFDGEKEIKSYGYAETSEHKGMSSEQCTGTASSYARKYALNGLFLIDETESDADHNDKTEHKKIELNPTHTNWAKIKEGVQSGKFSIDQVKEKYQISNEVEKLLK